MGTRRKKKQQDETEEIQVRLKPFLGIDPGVYLTVIYGIILALILFLVLVYPGIKNNGSKITVTSSPAGARVYLDGRYAGATPCTVFAEKGKRILSVERDFYTVEEEHLDVKGRLFASLIAPRRVSLHKDLTLADRQSFLESAFREASAWALIESYHDNYQYPPVIREALRAMNESEVPYEVTGEFLDAAAALVSSENLLADYLAARAEAETGGGVFSPAALLELVQKYILFLETKPAFLFWLPESMPADHRETLTSSDWFPIALDSYRRFIEETKETSPAAFASVRFEGMTFIGIRGGSFLLGSRGDSEYMVPVEVEDFYILDREVTREMYAAFLEDNPGWSPSRTDSLLREGLVQEGYLTDYNLPGAEGLPVRYVSQYAAEAFCRWLEDRLPARFTGWSARLPREEEWEWAARGDGRFGGTFQAADVAGPSPASQANSLGVYDLSGNLWEWCDNWYYPAAYMTLPGTIMDAGTEKAVRGGSWANPRDDVTISTRGSQPAAWCTPFTGFRPVIVRE